MNNHIKHISCDDILIKDDFVGIFNGNSDVSNYLVNNLYSHFKTNEQTNESTWGQSKEFDSRIIESKMTEIDKMIPPNSNQTIIFTIINNNYIYCVNNGNSRVILSTNYGIEVLSNDHKPNLSFTNSEIIIKELDNSVNFMILATHGIWDIMTNEQVEEYVKERLHLKSSEEICKDILEKCEENNSIIIIIFSKVL